MEELQIPTRGVDVEIYTDDGVCLSGTLFLAQTRFSTGEPSDVVHLLNDERTFVPFQCRTRKGRRERNLILNKDHIVRVRVRRGKAPGAKKKGARRARGSEKDRGGAALPVVVLSDGTRLTAEVAVDAPRAACRLVDKLNQPQRFIPLISDVGIDFVQRRHVLRLD